VDHYDVIIVGSRAGGGTLAPSGNGCWFWSGATGSRGSRRTGTPRRSSSIGGISPAWPIGYDVVEPHYTAAEQVYQVHGVRDEDPTDPPASAPYLYPPVSHEPRIQQLFGDANGSDQVGRSYVLNSRAFLAVSTEKNGTSFQKTLGLNDYYFGDPHFDYPMGNVQMVGKSSAPMYGGEKPVEAALAPMFATGASCSATRPTTRSRWNSSSSGSVRCGSATTRRPRCWTSTAGPTRSTTSTWSIPASSRASAR